MKVMFNIVSISMNVPDKWKNLLCLKSAYNHILWIKHTTTNSKVQKKDKKKEKHTIQFEHYEHEIYI